MKRLELTGKKFGRWLVLECVGANRSRNSVWKCRCDCGVEKDILSTSLVVGLSKSCGCYNSECLSIRSKEDLLNKRFGRLKALYEEGRNKQSRVLWLCECDCGRKTSVPANHLKSGHTTSCGCYRGVPSYKHGKAGTREYKNAKSAERRIMKLNQTPSNVNIEEICKIYKICEDMNERAKYVVLPKSPHNGAWFHVDHEIPLSKGGFHHQDNLQVMWWTDNLNERKKLIKRKRR